MRFFDGSVQEKELQALQRLREKIQEMRSRKMKHGKKPTVRQKKFLSEHHLCPDNWLISSDTPRQMIIIHRHTDAAKVIVKGRENEEREQAAENIG